MQHSLWLINDKLSYVYGWTYGCFIWVHRKLVIKNLKWYRNRFVTKNLRTRVVGKRSSEDREAGKFLVETSKVGKVSVLVEKYRSKLGSFSAVGNFLLMLVSYLFNFDRPFHLQVFFQLPFTHVPHNLSLNEMVKFPRPKAREALEFHNEVRR